MVAMSQSTNDGLSICGLLLSLFLLIGGVIYLVEWQKQAELDDFVSPSGGVVLVEAAKFYPSRNSGRGQFPGCVEYVIRSPTTGQRRFVIDHKSSPGAGERWLVDTSDGQIRFVRKVPN